MSSVHSVVPPVVPVDLGHRVQFFENDEFLVGAIVDFLAGGLTSGQPLVVIATGDRRSAVTHRLTTDGFDVDNATRNGQLAMFDARATLDTFMRGTVPDVARFKTVIGDALTGGAVRDPAQPVRVYGEMVDLLWRDGNTEGALQLEDLWNGLSNDFAFSLLCAYAMGNFYRATDADHFREICRRHTHVAPTERYVRDDDEAYLRDVALLQQRAQALASEIEHRKDLEQRLRDRERELRELLAERERLLLAERIARGEAEAASRAKSDFLAMMSHELRTPLNAIGGHVQLIEMEVHGPISDAQREALLRVERSQRHLLSLINEVLNLTRIESGHVDYTIEDVALAPLIADTVSMLAPMIAASRLTCDVVTGHHLSATHASPIIARADREKTHQILVNLLTNAIKFTPAGGRLLIELAMKSGDAGLVQVRVADTGIGIPAAQLEHIFEPFVQVGRMPGPATPGRRDGVGLGLPISRDLARGMGGDLAVESTVGVGTTFTLCLLPNAS
jgi:signal transduction histidine kinase